tara:strand:+ start:40 stop:531 length:492 start_codon:yes stop_codon:yes gene_type:complete
MLDYIKINFVYDNGFLVRIKKSGGEKIGSIAGYNTLCNGKTYRKLSIDYKTTYVHHAIFILHHGYLPKYIDHIDGNSLNNKIENLRVATQSQNLANAKMQKRNTSGYKGVSFRKDSKKWRATIGVNGKLIFLGDFFKKEDAAKAYELGAIKNYFEFARTDCNL